MDKIPLLAYVYLLSILLAFLSSLISFRLDLAFQWKLFACLLGLTLPVEIIATASAYVTKSHNAWLYNGFALLEFLAYGYIFRALLPEKNSQWLFITFFLLFPVIWLISIKAIFGFEKWNSYVIVTGSFFTVVWSLLVYYKILLSHEVRPLKNIPEFWFATAMLTGYLATLPYYGALNFLNQYHKKVASDLYPVLRFANICMYLTFTYVFICQIRNTKKSLFRS